MKRTILFILSIVLLFTIVGAQQIDNPGFEAWEDAGTVIDEPVDWSTVKTSDNPVISSFAPVTWEQSDVAHSGEYSVKLFNVYSEAADLVVAGTMTNGRIHGDFNPDSGYVFTDPENDEWNTSLTSRPDSIAFWFKFFPEGNDTLQFQAMLHVGEGTLPPKPNNQMNMVAYTRADIPGEYAEWTRIALPFNYYNDLNPEYILIILTSGNGTIPVEDSYALFDDLEIIGGAQSISDTPLDDNSIYIANKTIYLNNVSHEILKDSDVEIVDLTGRVIYSNTLVSSEVSLDLINIQTGFYVVRLISKKGTYSKKFFIQ